ncbi:eCIS core domain-containing protein [Laspinema olomoucense]|uniref:eCIS core domain-containing protein n=1 Tax=Laspinema olomoucense TaxID=3231600 RepID=UPI0021BAB043|nr:DUF4157 domain-containing protein [Laspinema sp. D3c]MCT7997461.1 DUF4157 domain-containing protein [Laspinema sp. D3c]
MTKEFISRKTAGNFQKTTSQFAPRPFATPQQKSAKTENSTPQDIQCSPESSNRLSRIAITQPETFTPQLTVQRAEQAQGANDNPREEVEKIQRSSTDNNRLAKISIQAPEPPSTPRFPIQAKLTVGAAGDKYEQEADRVARQVVNRIHAPQVNLNSSESNPVQRKISIQALGGEGGDVSSEWESELNRARGGGQPLSPSLREPMEREFGADFGGVRVHTGAQADALSRSIQAKAFTTGQDVFFRQGAYEPCSSGGQELLAHELTHVVQQQPTILRTKIEEGTRRNQEELQNHDSRDRHITNPAREGVVQRQLTVESGTYRESYENMRIAYTNGTEVGGANLGQGQTISQRLSHFFQGVNEQNQMMNAHMIAKKFGGKGENEDNVQVWSRTFEDGMWTLMEEGYHYMLRVSLGHAEEWEEFERQTGDVAFIEHEDAKYTVIPIKGKPEWWQNIENEMQSRYAANYAEGTEWYGNNTAEVWNTLTNLVRKRIPKGVIVRVQVGSTTQEIRYAGTDVFPPLQLKNVEAMRASNDINTNALFYDGY